MMHRHGPVAGAQLAAGLAVALITAAGLASAATAAAAATPHDASVWSRTINGATLTLDTNDAFGSSSGYNLTSASGGTQWLRGVPPAVHCAGQWFTTSGTANTARTGNQLRGGSPDSDHEETGPLPLVRGATKTMSNVSVPGFSTLAQCDAVQTRWTMQGSGALLAELAVSTAGGDDLTWVTTVYACASSSSRSPKGRHDKHVTPPLRSTIASGDTSASGTFVFSQSFPQGCPVANSTARPANATIQRPGDQFESPMTTLSEFPAWSARVPWDFDAGGPAPSGDSLTSSTTGWLSWSGTFAVHNDGDSHDPKMMTAFERYAGGVQGGPIVLYNASADDDGRGLVLVMSPLNEFSTAVHGRRGGCAHGGMSRAYEHGKPSGGRGATTTCPVMVQGVDFEGNDLYNVPNASAPECCAACAAESRCVGFSHLRASADGSSASQCWLKHSVAGVNSAPPSHTSGSLCPADVAVAEVLTAGVRADIVELDPGYSLSFVLSPYQPPSAVLPSTPGTNTPAPQVNAAVRSWGGQMQRAHGTWRLAREHDVTNTKLGVWTDNGATLYGGAPPDERPNTTNLEHLFASLAAQHVPVQYLQLDPYWYHARWEPSGPQWPGGFEALRDAIGVPLLLYYNYLDTLTPAAYNYSYDFVTSLNYFHNGHAQLLTQVAPHDALRFFTDIFGRYALPRSGGLAPVMRATEIDFSDYMPQLWPSLNAKPGQVEAVEAGLAGAALTYNVSVQYCMALPMQILMTLDLPAVTNARASGDNFPEDFTPSGFSRPYHNFDRIKIAYTSLFLGSLAIRPFMDVIWTTANQPGNVYGVSRHNVELQAIIATLSAGPVGIGDMAGRTNATLTSMIADTDGTLMQPSDSGWATPIDAMYLVVGDTRRPADADAEVMQAHTAVSDGSGGAHQFYSVLAMNVATPFALRTDYLFPSVTPGSPSSFVATALSQRLACAPTAWTNNTRVQAAACVLPFDAATPLTLSTGAATGEDYTHELFSVSPVCPGGYALLGDMSKIVAVAAQRFTSVVCGANAGPAESAGITVGVAGVPGTTVDVDFLVPGAQRHAGGLVAHAADAVASGVVHRKSVALDASGRGVIAVP